MNTQGILKAQHEAEAACWRKRRHLGPLTGEETRALKLRCAALEEGWLAAGGEAGEFLLAGLEGELTAPEVEAPPPPAKRRGRK